MEVLHESAAHFQPLPQLQNQCDAGAKATFHTSLLETRCLMDAILRGHLRQCLMQGGGHPHSAFMKRRNLIDLKSRSCIKNNMFNR